MLHNKLIYVIVVPHICCSKNPTTCTCFFLWSAVRLDPCHHSDTVSKFTVSQWDHTSSKVGPLLTPAHAGSETRHVSGCSLLKNISYKFMSDITYRFMCVLFFLYSVFNSGRKPTARLFTQTGHECRRRCQLLQRETVNR